MTSGSEEEGKKDDKEYVKDCFDILLKTREGNLIFEDASLTERSKKEADSFLTVFLDDPDNRDLVIETYNEKLEEVKLDKNISNEERKSCLKELDRIGIKLGIVEERQQSNTEEKGSGKSKCCLLF